MTHRGSRSREECEGQQIKALFGGAGLFRKMDRFFYVTDSPQLNRAAHNPRLDFKGLSIEINSHLNENEMTFTCLPGVKSIQPKL